MLWAFEEARMGIGMIDCRHEGKLGLDCDCRPEEEVLYRVADGDEQSYRDLVGRFLNDPVVHALVKIMTRLDWPENTARVNPRLLQRLQETSLSWPQTTSPLPPADRRRS